MLNIKYYRELAIDFESALNSKFTFDGKPIINFRYDIFQKLTSEQKLSFQEFFDDI